MQQRSSVLFRNSYSCCDGGRLSRIKISMHIQKTEDKLAYLSCWFSWHSWFCWHGLWICDLSREDYQNSYQAIKLKVSLYHCYIGIICTLAVSSYRERGGLYIVCGKSCCCREEDREATTSNCLHLWWWCVLMTNAHAKKKSGNVCRVEIRLCSLWYDVTSK